MHAPIRSRAAGFGHAGSRRKCAARAMASASRGQKP
jgi:hypothetical protein